MHWKPARQKEKLARDRRHGLPGDLAEKRQVKPRVSVRLFYAAQFQSLCTSTDQDRIVCGEPSEFQCEVRFYRGVQLRGAFGVNVPAAISQLRFQNVLDALRFELRVDLLSPMH